MEQNIFLKMTDQLSFKTGYAPTNGISMYYEIYGTGAPLILIHGGGSTIQTSFGRIIPILAQRHQLIGVELQAHGRSGDRDTALSFEQDADDVSALMDYLGIDKADILGFSNGGTTALYLAIQHPTKVNKIIAASALCKRSGAPAQFWELMNQAQLEHMPQEYKDAYIQVAPNPENLIIMHDKCAERMRNFQDMPDEGLQSIQAPTLVLIADQDVMSPEHAVEVYRLIPNAQLAIIPGGHGAYLGEITTLQPGYSERDFVAPMLERFLGE